MERQTDSQLPNLMSLITCREVAERTVRVARLNEDPDALRNRIEVNTAPNPGAKTREELSTDIIQIKVRDTDPERAVRTVNCLAHVFASFYQEVSHKEAADNRKFLESELANAKKQLAFAAERLKAFKQRNKLVVTADSSKDAIANLRQVMAAWDTARAQLAEVNAKLRDIDRQLSQTSPTVMVSTATSDTPMVTELETKIAQLTAQLNDAQSKYEDSHPEVQRLKGLIEDLKSKLQIERGKMRTTTSVSRNPLYDNLLQQRSTLAAERDGLAAKVAELEGAVVRASGEVKPGADVEITKLENEFLAAQAACADLTAKLNNARISEKETTSTGAIHIVDEAVSAVGPIGPNKLLYLMMGALLSLIAGVGLAITLESLDNRIKTNLDAEKLLGLPVTTLIPRSLESNSSSLAREVFDNPLSPVAEAYRFLRTDFLLSAKEVDARAVMVATAKPGQGGTSTVANLGISLALDGKRVVLVDADMRRPSLHAIFKATNELGLSNVLSNERDLEEVILGTEVDNLFLIPAGPMPSNPSELLGSGRMRMLVQKLTEYADYVLFDTPSAVAFTDAVVLSQIVDGVILVVRAQQVPRGAELQVRNLLNKANANILGVVLNDVEPEYVDSYYFHSHYYPDTGLKKRKALTKSGISKSLPPKQPAA
jgi:capsular exopolysaccharide synthesis family protein